MFNTMDVKIVGTLLFIFFLFYHVAAVEFDLEEKYHQDNFEIDLPEKGVASTGRLYFHGFRKSENNMSFYLKVSDNYGIVFNLEHMRLHDNCDNYIEFTNLRMANRFCRSTLLKNREVDSLVVLDTPVTLNIFKKHHVPPPKFDLGYTVIKKGNCDNSTFRCESGYCIWESLVCDGYNNCGDDSDEIDLSTNEICPPARYLSWDMRSILILLAVILIPISMLALCIIIACSAKYSLS